MSSIVNLFNEIGMLAHTPRSGFAFLGTGKQSVSEHSYRMALIGFVLAELSEKPVDKYKLLMMCLLHDLPEARTGDLNYVNKRYAQANVDQVLNDFEKDYPLGRQIAAYVRAYEKEISIEAQLAHDADQIEMLLALKEQADFGNPKAMIWFEKVEQRLETEAAKKIAKEILATSVDAWWLQNKEDPHLINGGKSKN